MTKAGAGGFETVVETIFGRHGVPKSTQADARHFKVADFEQLVEVPLKQLLGKRDDIIHRPSVDHNLSIDSIIFPGLEAAVRFAESATQAMLSKATDR